ncbi:bifunctional tRNA (5-methylaminomethyl-2-thiouridine)(34)-methyltransferase MnmD/FAD-dependent 5-carboxymethylaminomethyl-2-thiouridine(34) oxidoreductase MnmC [Campylobacter insulaenigrae]|uniref:bifunctional tRNA (5-methylaminomethyl-2-thiouridine)(34)-methyltransferase MnmD/FAD-dependent 5-carboxymethylaminomethyl-2-thiouridine(34) oxidoreductase MnmC n=1 Tax=Campylobacter insulaenigrae TaxID=260714 RepID=UPI00215377EA|nr:bifunctional tRNA (5-methylaminomethyl-2-thiouridine)(34)-methyltransferase MnmD/FAD-dependent 5-carboxymethylaminomethyl-2-thiouridine(34) oxidoreductase MnmC [Campylobacter insulaenigrae]MCR6570235.1 bifunctional tRNA (5-methylaminomethyl-2-thiouridine)(34)-methyltransferase MnmD/FAD-dependent 5-carboxymethylaminomethyl-2-thiouridine(34) oxidoreductase MnmC [Campylobacter insulaenigrae]MCR6575846.1 bifunctional tRNA (5-methylaminomethyl-2-thiouridine)(34)-methyltransferase MnmD/FAD-dependent
MNYANIIIKEDSVFSLDFEDYYFNSKDGINESSYVYTNAFEFNKEQIIVSELGFGIGLNFFLTLKRFLAEKKSNQRLFYVSFENFYISKEQLRDIYKKLNFYDEFKNELELFLKYYPPCKNGIYRFYFDGCFLDLVFGDIKETLQQVNFEANVWYLDGFAPSKNYDMFKEDTIYHVARNSAIKARILTFSAASSLRKTLQKYNFSVYKVKGFKKREMIQAIFDGYEYEDMHAYFNTPSLKRKVKNVAIIGAGIAGASLAYELSLRNCCIDIFEKENDVAKGASGNISGILSSLILKPQVLLGEFSQYSFLEASRFYQQNLNLKPQGVYEFAHNDLMQERFDSQKDNILFDIEHNRAFLKDGICVKPQEIVKTMISKSKAKVFLQYEFEDYCYENNQFTLKFKNINHCKKYDVLIYAQGANAKDFVDYSYMQLSRVRGQCTHLKPFLNTQYALSSKAYICPMNEHVNMQLIGASYDRLNQNSEISIKDNIQNLNNIQEFIDHNTRLEIVGAKVGFRSYSSDRFAIIGQSYDEKFYLQHYKALLWHKNKKQIQPEVFLPLYLSIAHGSRAFSSAIIASRLICSLIFGEPQIEKRFLHALHPARFLIRKLKKGLI